MYNSDAGVYFVVHQIVNNLFRVYIMRYSNQHCYVLYIINIYTIILWSVCLSVLANCNSWSIVSGDVSNCSYWLKVHPVTLASQYGQTFFLRKNPPKLSRISSRPRVVYLNEAPTCYSLASVEKVAITPSWLGAPTHQTAMVVGGCVCVRACVRDVFAIYAYI